MLGAGWLTGILGHCIRIRRETAPSGPIPMQIGVANVSKDAYADSVEFEFKQSLYSSAYLGELNVKLKK